MDISAPDAANSLDFTGYDGKAMDICAKITALLAQTEKIRLLIDTYVDPVTMKYKMEAIYPGLPPPGTIRAYRPHTGSPDAIKDEVWRLQRTTDDLVGVTTETVKDKSVWTVCDGTTVGGVQTPDLKARFLVGAAQIAADQEGKDQWMRTTKPVGEMKGIEKVVLTTPQGAMVQHTHYIGSLGTPGGVGAGDWVAATTSPIQTTLPPGVMTHNAENDVPMAVNKFNVRSSGIITPSGVPGTPIDLPPDPDPTKNYAVQPHDNLPPYYVVVWIMRTNRVDSTT